MGRRWSGHRRGGLLCQVAGRTSGVLVRARAAGLVSGLQEGRRRRPPQSLEESHRLYGDWLARGAQHLGGVGLRRRREGGLQVRSTLKKPGAATGCGRVGVEARRCWHEARGDPRGWRYQRPGAGQCRHGLPRRRVATPTSAPGCSLATCSVAAASASATAGDGAAPIGPARQSSNLRCGRRARLASWRRSSRSSSSSHRPRLLRGPRCSHRPSWASKPPGGASGGDRAIRCRRCRGSDGHGATTGRERLVLQRHVDTY